jgi:hypothetical protein
MSSNLFVYLPNAIYLFCNLYLTRQVSYEQILIYNDNLPRPNPDDTGPIVRRPIGLPITAGCDAAWILEDKSFVEQTGFSVM